MTSLIHYYAKSSGEPAKGACCISSIKFCEGELISRVDNSGGGMEKNPESPE